VAFQHLAEVERNWFHRVLTGESVPAIHCPGADPEGPNSGFELAEGAKLADALATWEAKILQARANWKGRELGATSAFMAAEVPLRWICIHMIGEYARHHAQAPVDRGNISLNICLTALNAQIRNGRIRLITVGGWWDDEGRWGRRRLGVLRVSRSLRTAVDEPRLLTDLAVPPSTVEVPRGPSDCCGYPRAAGPTSACRK
jgi:hypothetical protein